MQKIEPQIIDKLKYIKITNDKTDISQFPNFLVLGPQRTGTTWLSENLRLHPEVFFTEPKEIFFFNTLNNINHPLYQSNELAWYLNFFKTNFQELFKKNLIFILKYREFYRPKIRGEGTACNATLPKSIIQEIVALNPDIKCILMIRNPVKRAWAHAKKDLLNRTERNLEEVSDSEFEKFFRQKYQLSCGNYTTIINNWTTYLKNGNLFIGTFDEIAEAPKELLLRVFDFLEISTNPKYVDNVKSKQKVQATDINQKARKLPQKYQTILEEIFNDEIVKLEKMLGKALVK